MSSLTTDKDTEETEFTVVNIVGSGDIGKEVEVDALEEDVPFDEAYQMDGDNPGLYMRQRADGPLTTLFSSGKYIVRAPYGTEQGILEESDNLIKTLTEMGLLQDDDEPEFSIKNIVCSGAINKDINIHAMAIALGLENIEYEPEVFPALLYTTDDYPCVFLAFNSGKIVVAGADTKEASYGAFREFIDELNEYM